MVTVHGAGYEKNGDKRWKQKPQKREELWMRQTLTKVCKARGPGFDSRFRLKFFS